MDVGGDIREGVLIEVTTTGEEKIGQIAADLKAAQEQTASLSSQMSTGAASAADFAAAAARLGSGVGGAAISAERAAAAYALLQGAFEGEVGSLQTLATNYEENIAALSGLSRAKQRDAEAMLQMIQANLEAAQSEMAVANAAREAGLNFQLAEEYIRTLVGVTTGASTATEEFKSILSNLGGTIGEEEAKVLEETEAWKLRTVALKSATEAQLAEIAALEARFAVPPPPPVAPPGGGASKVSVVGSEYEQQFANLEKLAGKLDQAFENGGRRANQIMAEMNSQLKELGQNADKFNVRQQEAFTNLNKRVSDGVEQMSKLNNSLASVKLTEMLNMDVGAYFSNMAMGIVKMIGPLAAMAAGFAAVHEVFGLFKQAFTATDTFMDLEEGIDAVTHSAGAGAQAMDFFMSKTVTTRATAEELGKAFEQMFPQAKKSGFGQTQFEQFTVDLANAGTSAHKTFEQMQTGWEQVERGQVRGKNAILAAIGMTKDEFVALGGNLDPVKKKIEALADSAEAMGLKFSNIMPKINELIGKGLSEGFREAGDGGRTAAATIVKAFGDPAIQKALGEIGKMARDLLDTFLSILPGIVVFAAGAIEVLTAFVDVVKALWNGLKVILLAPLAGVFHIISEAFKTLGLETTEVGIQVTSLAESFKQGLGEAWKGVQKNGEGAAGAIKNFGDVVTGALGGLNKFGAANDAAGNAAARAGGHIHTQNEAVLQSKDAMAAARIEADKWAKSLETMFKIPPAASSMPQLFQQIAVMEEKLSAENDHAIAKIKELHAQADAFSYKGMSEAAHAARVLANEYAAGVQKLFEYEQLSVKIATNNTFAKIFETATHSIQAASKDIDKLVIDTELKFSAIKGPSFLMNDAEANFKAFVATAQAELLDLRNQEAEDLAKAVTPEQYKETMDYWEARIAEVKDHLHGTTTQLSNDLVAAVDRFKAKWSEITKDFSSILTGGITSGFEGIKTALHGIWEKTAKDFGDALANQLTIALGGAPDPNAAIYQTGDTKTSGTANADFLKDAKTASDKNAGYAKAAITAFAGISEAYQKQQTDIQAGIAAVAGGVAAGYAVATAIGASGGPVGIIVGAVIAAATFVAHLLQPSESTNQKYAGVSVVNNQAVVGGGPTHPDQNFTPDELVDLRRNTQAVVDYYRNGYIKILQNFPIDVFKAVMAGVGQVNAVYTVNDAPSAHYIENITAWLKQGLPDSIADAMWGPIAQGLHKAVGMSEAKVQEIREEAQKMDPKDALKFIGDTVAAWTSIADLISKFKMPSVGQSFQGTFSGDIGGTEAAEGSLSALSAKMQTFAFAMGQSDDNLDKLIAGMKGLTGQAQADQLGAIRDAMADRYNKEMAYIAAIASQMDSINKSFESQNRKYDLEKLASGDNENQKQAAILMQDMADAMEKLKTATDPDSIKRLTAQITGDKSKIKQLGDMATGDTKLDQANYLKQYLDQLTGQIGKTTDPAKLASLSQEIINTIDQIKTLGQGINDPTAKAAYLDWAKNALALAQKAIDAQGDAMAAAADKANQDFLAKFKPFFDGMTQTAPELDKLTGSTQTAAGALEAFADVLKVIKLPTSHGGLPAFEDKFDAMMAQVNVEKLPKEVKDVLAKISADIPKGDFRDIQAQFLLLPDLIKTAMAALPAGDKDAAYLKSIDDFIKPLLDSINKTVTGGGGGPGGGGPGDGVRIRNGGDNPNDLTPLDYSLPAGYGGGPGEGGGDVNNFLRFGRHAVIGTNGVTPPPPGPGPATVTTSLVDAQKNMLDAVLDQTKQKSKADVDLTTKLDEVKTHLADAMRGSTDDQTNALKSKLDALKDAVDAAGGKPVEVTGALIQATVDPSVIINIVRNAVIQGGGFLNGSHTG